jgi:hypothetical protein
MHLSMQSIYFQSNQGLSPWDYEGIDSAHTVARGILEFGGVAQSGENVQYRVTSAWSARDFLNSSPSITEFPHPVPVS